MNIFRAAFVVLLAVVSGACTVTHPVQFEQVSYTVPVTAPDDGAVAVIEPFTATRVVPIRSYMAGAGNSWEIQAGVMLTQVADIELGQMFGRYSRMPSYEEPAQGAHRLTVVLTMPHYTFNDFRADVSVHAAVFGPGKTPVFERAYTGVGDSQGGKMFFAGAFGMKSAIRQSSLDAFQQIFQQLRSDLLPLLTKPVETAAPSS